MTKNSKIEWTSHTYNMWRGCTKIAPGCTNCYADAQSKRNPGTLGIWGDNGTRVVASESMWREPVKWNEAAEQIAIEVSDHNHRFAGNPNIPMMPEPERPRVFCASLADVFEDWKGRIYDHTSEVLLVCDTCGKYHRDDHAALSESCECGRFKQRMDWLNMQDVRARLFKLIDATPNLDWLLLTKRPENVRRMWPDREQNEDEHYYCEEPFLDEHGEWQDGVHRCRPWYRDNVWLGTSIANQDDADRNIPELLKCRDLASVLFVSAEPLIGPVKLNQLFRNSGDHTYVDDCLTGFKAHKAGGWYGPRIDWVITGGESGPKARPCNVDWIRDIGRQCQDAGVAWFNKQLGARPTGMLHPGTTHALCLKDKKGGDMSEWPEDLRVRQLPEVTRCPAT